jgi:hypothetical protein
MQDELGAENGPCVIHAAATGQTQMMSKPRVDCMNKCKIFYRIKTVKK